MILRDRVLLDASVLLAAAGSPRGGSSAAIAVLLGFAQYETVISNEIDREARTNLRLKFAPFALARFEALRGELMPILADPDDASPLADLPASVAAKDHHVIPACLAADVSICLTLDRRHLLTADVRQWGTRRGLQILTPGEFLAWHWRRRAAGP